MSIDYAFRPRLRIRLTLGGFTFPRKPWAYGVQDFHLHYRYSSRHIHFQTLHGSFRNRFDADWNALLPIACAIPRLRLSAYSRSFSALKSSASELLRTL